MTTLIGVRTNIGSDAVVIASDTQMSFFDEERNPLSKKTFYKILTGDYWILAHSGDGTEYLRKFCSRITYPDRFKDFDKKVLNKEIIEAVEKKRYLRIDNLNAEHSLENAMEVDEDDEIEFVEFLFAIREGNGLNSKLHLYRIDSYGNLIPPKIGSSYLVLGTSKKKIKEYLTENVDEGESYKSGNLDLETSLDLCDNILEKFAETDIYTGGLMDFAVLTKDKIFHYGEELKQDLREFRKKRIKDKIKEIIPDSND